MANPLAVVETDLRDAAVEGDALDELQAHEFGGCELGVGEG